MSDPDPSANIAQGHYYQKQIACKSHSIAWSHSSRFAKALQLLGTNRYNRLLDYGCGDGTMLTMISGHAEECWGADIADGQLEDCRKRLESLSNTRFCNVSYLRKAELKASFDMIFCMETLEHCTSDVVDNVIGDLSFLCRPDGKVIISVPIETGLTFLIKKVIRSLAAWRGLSQYHYYERYPIRDALRMITAGEKTIVERPVYGPIDAQYHSHYGFNWRHIRQRVSKAFDIERTTFSPLSIFGGIVCSQAWFICRPKVIL